MGACGRTAPPSPVYRTLLEPAGRLYFAGDHLSYVTAWQHGAFESARHVVTALHQRASHRVGRPMTSSLHKSTGLGGSQRSWSRPSRVVYLILRVLGRRTPASRPSQTQQCP